jgi:hypothetical protein
MSTVPHLVEFTTAGGQLTNEFTGTPTSANPRELFDFEYQVNAVDSQSGGEINYEIIEGQLPNDLSINAQTGFISGTVIDLDTWVDEFQKPSGFTIARDGSNYGTYGSAQAGQYLAEFTIRAFVVSEPVYYADQDCSILVINNYSSDRDQFIRDYSAEYGNTFIVNGEPVSAEEYLEYQKSIGNFPPLSNV